MVGTVLCRFMTVPPLPTLKAAVTISSDSLIENLIGKINQTIMSETGCKDYQDLVQLPNSTQRLVLEQCDGYRLPASEPCTVIDSEQTVMVRLTDKVSFIPPPSTNSQDPQVETATIQHSSHEPTPLKREIRSPDTSRARSHIAGFRKSAPNHYRRNESSSSGEEHPWVESSDDSDGTDVPFSQHQYNFRNNLRASTSQLNRRNSASIRSSSISINSTNRNKRLRRLSSRKTVAVVVPFLPSLNTPGCFRPRRQTISFSSNASLSFSRTKRSVYEIYLLDKSFRAAATQGPQRIPYSLNGLNDNSSVQQVLNYLKLYDAQSWKLVIGDWIWLSKLSQDKLEGQSEKERNRILNRESIQNNRSLTLKELNVHPISTNKNNNNFMSVIRNWDVPL
ncbi:hypothetical protein O181_022102 [Austropuccinia psidii MF-1]|uniref:Uncharacterized protein n=1 Tax=Austropuccinia psidii MF-1 TaxID=1389203 RepID=A0A9Q3CGU0_9BASI|nr:hypothetical protein [Austropuccinia psidii MF-1]